jgi:lysophospholipase L1-like esterase
MELDPDIILLLVGTNEFFNIGSVQSGHDADRDGPKRLATLVDRIHGLKPDVKVSVGSVMPVAWTKDFANAFNSALPVLFKDKPNTWFVDTGSLADFKAGDWSDDGLHPSESGYRKLAGVWMQALKEFLIASGSIKQATQSDR